MRLPFFRSYGKRLPSSLTWVISRALGYSPRPPVSVYDTGAGNIRYGFSGPFRFHNFELCSRAIPSPEGYRCRPPIRRYVNQPTHHIRIAIASGDGISTVCPSPTPFGLGLGPPNHQRTNLADEILGFRRQRFSLCFSLLIPGFALVLRPAALTLDLQPITRRSPTTHKDQESI